MRNYGIPQVHSAARILLVCPDCGHENSTAAEALRGRTALYCEGDDCDYIFNLAGANHDGGKGFIDAFKRFYASFYAPRGQGAR